MNSTDLLVFSFKPSCIQHDWVSLTPPLKFLSANAHPPPYQKKKRISNSCMDSKGLDILGDMCLPWFRDMLLNEE